MNGCGFGLVQAGGLGQHGVNGNLAPAGLVRIDRPKPLFQKAERRACLLGLVLGYQPVALGAEVHRCADDDTGHEDNEHARQRAEESLVLLGEEAGQAVPGSDASATAGGDHLANADSVTIEAMGLLEGALMTVELEYWESDHAGGDVSDLRLHRLHDETGEYVPAGTNHVGDEHPSDAVRYLGDHGHCSRITHVWARVDTLGTFAVGIAELETLPLTIGAGDTTGAGGCEAGGGMCGALGMLCLPMTALTMIAMRRRTRPNR